MRIAAIIQARMGSTRVPNKMLESIGGAPLLTRVVERVRACATFGDVIVATSRSPNDDAIATLCASLRLPVVRGPLNDVAARLLTAVDKFELDAFVRVCGDSPLIDPTLIDMAVETLRGGGFDIVTNNLVRTFPKGQTVEALRSDVYRAGCARIEEADDREHVTRWFYQHADEFRIHNFTKTPDCSHLSLAVDTQDDLARIRDIYGTMRRPHWDFGLDWILSNVVVARG